MANVSPLNKVDQLYSFQRPYITFRRKLSRFFLFLCIKGLETWKAMVFVLAFNRRTYFEFPGWAFSSVDRLDKSWTRSF